jgi:large subunit ribosomal protein L21
MKFAVIAASGTQYRVEEGKEFLFDRLDKKEGETLSFDVMLYVDGDTVQLGNPLVKGRTVTAKIVGHERGDKIRVATFTAKSRRRRVHGHRSDFTRLQITSIK